MICLELNWLFYDPSWMLQLSEFVWALRSSVWLVFNNFLLIDATDKSKISIAIESAYFSHYAYTPFHFSRTLPLRAGSTFPVPACTVSPGLWVNKADKSIGLAGATRLQTDLMFYIGWIYFYQRGRGACDTQSDEENVQLCWLTM